MHSSRMCTVRCSGRRKGGWVSDQGGVSRGVVCVSDQGGVCPSVCWDSAYCPLQWPSEGVSARGVCARGWCVCLTRGCLPSACWDTPPLWTEFLTDACENSTFPRTVIKYSNKKQAHESNQWIIQLTKCFCIKKMIIQNFILTLVSISDNPTSAAISMRSMSLGFLHSLNLSSNFLCWSLFTLGKICGGDNLASTVLLLPGGGDRDSEDIMRHFSLIRLLVSYLR